MLNAAQQRGFDFFMGNTSNCSDGVSPACTSAARAGTGDNQAAFACHGCHNVDRAQGFFGADGKASFEAETQLVKIAHLRNLYQKVGMFGMPSVAFFANHGSVCLGGTNNGAACSSNANCPGGACGENIGMGDQIRGFGFLHDGSVSTLYQFLHAGVFSANGNVGFPNDDGKNGDTHRRDTEQFLLAFDSNLFPIVGQQITLTSTNSSVVGSRISLFISRAQVGDCDLVVKGIRLVCSGGSNNGGSCSSSADCPSGACGMPRGWYRTAAG